MKVILKMFFAVAVFGLAFGSLAVAQYEHPRAQVERITNGPRIESVTDHTATIAWSTDVGGSSVIRYGTNPNDLRGKAESPYARTGETHRVELRNLRPDTTYYYLVDSGQGEGSGTATQSGIQQFRTR